MTHSFPTRRSSDLMRTVPDREACWSELGVRHRSSNRSNAGRTWSSSPSPKAVMPHLARASMKQHLAVVLLQLLDGTGYTLRRSPQPDGRIAKTAAFGDRKSTRLNSSP